MRCILKQGLSSGSEGIWQGLLGAGVTAEPHQREATSLNMEKWETAAPEKAESQDKVTSSRKDGLVRDVNGKPVGPGPSCC